MTHQVRSVLVACAAIIFSMITFIQPAEAGGYPRVSEGRNGVTEVEFGDNGCVVYYDYKSRRVDNRASCSSDQIWLADRTLQNHREDHGSRYGLFGNDWGNGDGDNRRTNPDVTVFSNNKGKVDFHDGCTVDYNRKGERTYGTPDCTRDQLIYADRAIAAERFGGGRPSWGDRPSYSKPGNNYGYDDLYPVVKVHGNNKGTVGYSDGCSVEYNRKGERSYGSSECTSRQLRVADMEMSKARKAKGL